MSNVFKYTKKWEKSKNNNKYEKSEKTLINLYSPLTENNRNTLTKFFSPLTEKNLYNWKLVFLREMWLTLEIWIFLYFLLKGNNK